MTATHVVTCPSWCEAHGVDTCGGPIYGADPRQRVSVFNEIDRVAGTDRVVVEYMAPDESGDGRIPLTERQAFWLMQSLALALGERHGISEDNA